MSLRERRGPMAPFDVLVRESIRAGTASRLPEPDVRAQLLQRAERQEQRMARPSLSLGDLFGEQQSRFGYAASPNHFISLEGLFGPRTSWFSFNQLSR